MGRYDTDYMKAVKIGMSPPVVKRGWLFGHYDARIRE
jgi:hypothetical protein